MLVDRNDKNKKLSFKNSIGKNLQYMWESEIEPSSAEKELSRVLRKLKIPYVREVCFPKFKTENGGYYRYDFLLNKLGIILEYDGKEFHVNKRRDKIKNDYCKANSIPIYRFSGSDFFNLEIIIKDLLPVYYKTYKEPKKIITSEIQPNHSSKEIKERLNEHRLYISTIKSEKLNPEQIFKLKKRAKIKLKRKFDRIKH